MPCSSTALTCKQHPQTSNCNKPLIQRDTRGSLLSRAIPLRAKCLLPQNSLLPTVTCSQIISTQVQPPSPLVRAPAAWSRGRLQGQEEQPREKTDISSQGSYFKSTVGLPAPRAAPRHSALPSLQGKTVPVQKTLTLKHVPRSSRLCGPEGQLLVSHSCAARCWVAPVTGGAGSMGGTSLHSLSSPAARSSCTSPRGQPAPWGDMGQEGQLAAAVPRAPTRAGAEAREARAVGHGQLVHHPDGQRHRAKGLQLKGEWHRTFPASPWVDPCCSTSARP